MSEQVYSTNVEADLASGETLYVFNSYNEYYVTQIDNIIKLQPVSSNVTLNITLSAFLALLTISCVWKQNV